MDRFFYIVRDQSGQKIRGQVLALDRWTAAQKLLEQGFFIIELKKALRLMERRVSDRDLSFFCSQLTSLVDAGLPLAKALDIIASNTKSKRLKEALTQVSNLVKEGSSFAEALASYPKIFPEVLTEMMRVGEEGGILGEVLGRAGKYLEERSLLNSKIKRALTYPFFVLSLSLAALILLTVFILPTFGRVFKDFGVKLPLCTRGVIGFGEFMANYWYILIGFLAFFLIGLSFWAKRDKGRRILDYLKLNLPGVGEIARKVILSRTSRVLGTLLKGGVPILSALRVSSRVAGNIMFREAFIDLENEVKHGRRLASAMDKSSLFSPLVKQMVAVGQESGSLDKMLTQVADFYENEVEHAVKTLASFIEPVSTIGVGIVVGIIVVSMFLPLIRISSVLMQ